MNTNPIAAATEPAPTLSVVPWWDPHLAIVGHDPLGEYAETHWLPVLGPSALLALRWISRELHRNPAGVVVRHRDFAKALGLGARLGSDAPSVRCLDRLCYFELARADPEAKAWRGLAVRTHVPTLPQHLHKRLPSRIRSDTGG